MNNDLERLRGLAEAAKHDEHFTTTEAVDYMCAAKPQLIIDIIDRLRAAESELDNCKTSWALVSTERNALAKRLELIDAQEPWGYVAGSSFVKERPNYQTSADWSPVYEQKPAVHVWPNVPYGALVEHNQKLMRELALLSAPQAVPDGYVISRGSRAYKEVLVRSPDGGQQIFYPEDAAYGLVLPMLSASPKPDQCPSHESGQDEIAGDLS
jgi:hypothetical protein